MEHSIGASQAWHGPRPAATDYEISAQLSPHCLSVSVGGRPSIDQLVSALHVFGIESEDSTQSTMLIDLRLLEIGYGREDLLRIGHEIACSFAHLAKLALVVPPQRVTRISERAAQRGGTNMRVFDDESRARAWLHA